jgi:PAS domain S-box-containing protein
MNFNNKTENNSKELIQIEEYAKVIINTICEPLLVLNSNMKVISANNSFYNTFKVRPEETIGNNLFKLGNCQWDIPGLRELLDTIFIENTFFNNYEVEHDFPNICHKIMLLNARRVDFGNGNMNILLAIQDVTEYREKENESKEYEARFKHLFDTAQDGLFLLSYSEGKIENANPAICKMLGYSNEEIVGKYLYDFGILDKKEFETILQNLKEFGFIYYDSVPVSTKEGKSIDTEIYIVDRTKLIQCNVRDITERKKKEEDLRRYHDTNAIRDANRNADLEEINAELRKNNAELERLGMIELKKHMS